MSQMKWTENPIQPRRVVKATVVPAAAAAETVPAEPDLFEGLTVHDGPAAAPPQAPQPSGFDFINNPTPPPGGEASVSADFATHAIDDDVALRRSSSFSDRSRSSSVDGEDFGFLDDLIPGSPKPVQADVPSNPFPRLVSSVVRPPTSYQHGDQRPTEPSQIDTASAETAKPRIRKNWPRTEPKDPGITGQLENPDVRIKREYPIKQKELEKAAKADAAKSKKAAQATYPGRDPNRVRTAQSALPAAQAQPPEALQSGVAAPPEVRISAKDDIERERAASAARSIPEPEADKGAAAVERDRKFEQVLSSQRNGIVAFHPLYDDRDKEIAVAAIVMVSSLTRNPINEPLAAGTFVPTPTPSRGVAAGVGAQI